MKIIAKVVLYLVLVQLVTLLVASLQVFPSGSLPYSDTDRFLDDNGELSVNQTMNILFKEFSVEIPVVHYTLSIGWGSFTTILLTLIVIGYLSGTAPSTIVSVLFAYWMISMVWWSQSFFRNVISGYGDARITLSILLAIIFIGLGYLVVISWLESHTQGDVSDR